MTSWLRRNALPIAIVLVASLAVIGAVEVIDGMTTGQPLEGDAESEALTVGGLIKVLLFLTVPGAITLAVRRRATANP